MVGDPEMVTTPAANVAVTPAGNPLGVMPVAPLAVVYWILTIGVLIQTTWLAVAAAEVSAMVTSGLIVIVPVLVSDEQPPEVVTV